MSAGPPDVWVTRALTGAEATAARLRERGRRPLVSPLLAVRPLNVALDLAGVGALAFTSANGVDAAAAGGGTELPVFAVGDATAETARRAGFTRVESAAGDVTALAALIARRREAFSGAVLHPGAREPAGDLPGLLAAAGVPVRSAAVYEVDTVAPSPEAAAAWPTLEAVLLHSPKGARAFTAATAGWAPHAVRVLCLSAAVAQALGGVYPRVDIAPYPEEDALLNLLDVTGP